MGVNITTPIVDGQTIIYTGPGRGAVAVQLNKEGETVTAKQLWANTELSPRFCTPVLKDGLLYGLSDKAGFYCLNAKTGQMAWSEANSERGAFASILDAGSALIALTPKSHVIVFQPTDKAYTEVASIKVADTATYAHPVLAGDRLFIEDQELGDALDGGLRRRTPVLALANWTERQSAPQPGFRSRVRGHKSLRFLTMIGDKKVLRAGRTFEFGGPGTAA